MNLVQLFHPNTRLTFAPHLPAPRSPRHTCLPKHSYYIIPSVPIHLTVLYLSLIFLLPSLFLRSCLCCSLLLHACHGAASSPRSLREGCDAPPLPH
ncbi:hypothetical protein E2C01_035315 [Portunus trituberculatus]|uniref:Uncharacterized protein n=1 Tax=Portunus trituberculatus TaxID=210409 RepID=A0A5B7FB54_PORTR|nr:hypothetical protein [Portunus trituberculatus]